MLLLDEFQVGAQIVLEGFIFVNRKCKNTFSGVILAPFLTHELFLIILAHISK